MCPFVLVRSDGTKSFRRTPVRRPRGRVTRVFVVFRKNYTSKPSGKKTKKKKIKSPGPGTSGGATRASRSRAFSTCRPLLLAGDKSEFSPAGTRPVFTSDTEASGRLTRGHARNRVYTATGRNTRKPRLFPPARAVVRRPPVAAGRPREFQIRRFRARVFVTRDRELFYFYFPPSDGLDRAIPRV